MEKEVKEVKKKKYEGMAMVAIKGIGIRNNTKTYINGGKPKRRSG